MELDATDRQWWAKNGDAAQAAIKQLGILLKGSPAGIRRRALKILYRLCGESREAAPPESWARHPVLVPSDLMGPAAGAVAVDWSQPFRAACWVEQCKADGRQGNVAYGRPTFEVHNLECTEKVGMTTETLVDQVVPGGINSGWWSRQQYLYHSPLDGGRASIPPLMEEMGPKVTQAVFEYTLKPDHTWDELPGEVQWLHWEDAVAENNQLDRVPLQGTGGILNAWEDPLLWWSTSNGEQHLCSIAGWSTGRWTERVLSILMEGSTIHAEKAVIQVLDTGIGRAKDLVSACQRLENELEDRDVHNRVRFLSVRRILALVGVSLVHKGISAVGGRLKPGLINVDRLRQVVRHAILEMPDDSHFKVGLLEPVWDVTAVQVDTCEIIPPSAELQGALGRDGYPHLLASAVTIKLPPLPINRNSEIRQDEVAGSGSFNDAGRKLGLRSSMTGGTSEEDWYKEYIKLPLDIDSPLHYPRRTSDDGWDLIKDWGNRKIYSRVYAEEVVTLDRMLALVRMWFDLIARPSSFEIRSRANMFPSVNGIEIPKSVSLSELKEMLDACASNPTRSVGIERIDTTLPVSLSHRETTWRWYDWLLTSLLLCGPVHWEGKNSCLKHVAEKISAKLRWDPVVDPAGGATRLQVRCDCPVVLAQELSQFVCESWHGVLVSDGMAVVWKPKQVNAPSGASHTLWHLEPHSTYLVNVEVAAEVSNITASDSRLRAYGADGPQDAQAWVERQLEYYRQMRRSNQLHRVGDVHIGESAKAISEIAEEAQEQLRLEVRVIDGALEVKNRDGKLKRMWECLTSVNAEVLGIGGGFTKQHAEKHNRISVRSQVHLEELFLAKSRSISSETRSGEILALAGAVLMQAVFRGELVVRGGDSWVPEAFRSSDTKAFLLSGLLRLSAKVGRMVRSGPNGLQVALLYTQKHQVSMCLSPARRELVTGGLSSANSSMSFKLLAQTTCEPDSVHSGDVAIAAFRPWDSDWLLA